MNATGGNSTTSVAQIIDTLRAEREMIHEDLCAILRELGLSDGARPYSAHDVVHRDILPAIRRLRAQPDARTRRMLGGR